MGSAVAALLALGVVLALVLEPHKIDGQWHVTTWSGSSAPAYPKHVLRVLLGHLRF